MAVVDKNPNAPRGKLEGSDWPAWRYGPDGAAEIFASESEVPAGWVDHPSKVGAAPSIAAEPPTETPDRLPDVEPAPRNERFEIMKALRAKGIKFKPTLATELLRECLAEAEAAE